MRDDSDSNPARIVLITSGHDYPDRVLRGLRGNPPEAVLIAQLPRRPWGPGRIGGILRTKTPGQICRAVASRATARIAKAFRGGEDPRPGQWAGLAKKIIPVGILNGERMIAAISELRPDYLILAETGILSEETLALPGIGTLNAHPAILPFARGVGVVEHSLLRGIPAGVTTHFVETGIDTGAIVCRELIPVTPQDSLDSLRRKTTTRCTELLIESIATIGRGETLAPVRQTVSFPYCKWPSRAETAEASRLVQQGHARALYQRWRDHYQSDTLPPWDEAGPGTSGS